MSGRRKVLVEVNGVSMTVKEWSRLAGSRSRHAIMRRLRLGVPPIEAVFKSPAHAPRLARRQPPIPFAAYSLRPCVGTHRSYPIDMLSLLRRVA